MVECNMCKVAQVRVRGPLRSDKRGYVFLDSTGRQWSGKSCPDCRNSGTTGKTANSYTDFSQPLYPPKLRACGSCGIMNPNYYTCQSCINYREWLQPDTYVGCIDESMYGSSF